MTLVNSSKSRYNVDDVGHVYPHTKIHTAREVKNMLFLPREKGQGLVEYALILVLVAVVVIAILVLLGPIIGNVFSNIVSQL